MKKQNKTKTVRIGWKDTDGADEIYTEIYHCPKCKKVKKIGNNTILRHFIYCPTCGRKIVWNKDTK